MINLSFLQSDKRYIIVAPYFYHNQILSSLSALPYLLDYTLVDANTLINDHFGSIDQQGLALLVNRLNIDFMQAGELIKELPLYHLYKDKLSSNLHAQGLQIIESSAAFIPFVYQPSTLLFIATPLNTHLLSLIEKYNYPYLSITVADCAEKTFNISETIIDEVFCALDYISTLLKSGITHDQIMISYSDNSYKSILTSHAKAFNIQLNFAETTYLIDSSLGKKLIEYTWENPTFNIEDLISIAEEFSDVYALAFTTKLVEYYYCFKLLNQDRKSELLTYLLSITSCKQEQEGIKVGHDFILTNNSKYLIVLGANEDFPPTISTYQEKILIGTDVTLLPLYQLNFNLQKQYLQALGACQFLYLSYCRKDLSKPHLPSILFSELFDEKKLYKRSKFIPSAEYAQYLLSKDVEYTKEPLHTPLLNLAPSFLADFGSYSNQIKNNFPPQLVESIWGKGYHLSASSLNTFFSCSFRFLLDKLSLNNYNFNYPAHIGNFLHEALELHYTNSLNDVLQLCDRYFLSLPNDNRHSLFKKKLVEFTISLLHLLTENDDTEGFDEFVLEQSFKLDIASSRFSAKLIGKIDKLAFKNDSYIIVDYKSSTQEKIKLDYLQFGMFIQLPTYALASSSLYQDKTLSALLYQPLLTKYPLPTISFSGLVDDNALISLTSKITPVIKYNQSEYQKMLVDITNLIDSAVAAIESGQFKINPKSFILGQSYSCRFCQYFTICNKEIENEIVIELEEEEEYETE